MPTARIEPRAQRVRILSWIHHYAGETDTEETDAGLVEEFIVNGQGNALTIGGIQRERILQVRDAIVIIVSIGEVRDKILVGVGWTDGG